MNARIVNGVLLVGACACALVSCNTREDVDVEETAMVTSPVTQAVAVVHPLGDYTAEGTVRFAVSGEGVSVSVDVRGLKPGTHGFHVHEYGDCTASDGTSAGGHYNPHDQPHAGRADPERHVGDLGNIEADSTGAVQVQLHDPVIALEGPNSIIGRAVVIHAGADDLKSQPSGAAGDRVGCGVIGVAE